MYTETWYGNCGNISTSLKWGFDVLIQLFFFTKEAVFNLSSQASKLPFCCLQPPTLMMYMCANVRFSTSYQHIEMWAFATFATGQPQIHLLFWPSSAQHLFLLTNLFLLLTTAKNLTVAIYTFLLLVLSQSGHWAFVAN